MIWFIDTSALVKRYVKEQGSEWLRQEILGHKALIAQVSPVEIAAAFAMKFRRGDISEFAFHQARHRSRLESWVMKA